MSAEQISMFDFLRSQDPEVMKEQIKQSILAMSPEARKAMIANLCADVGNISRAIVENADAIWESRNAE